MPFWDLWMQHVNFTISQGWLASSTSHTFSSSKLNHVSLLLSFLEHPLNILPCAPASFREKHTAAMYSRCAPTLTPPPASSHPQNSANARATPFFHSRPALHNHPTPAHGSACQTSILRLGFLYPA